jgi:hypothetical protein
MTQLFIWSIDFIISRANFCPKYSSLIKKNSFQFQKHKGCPVIKDNKFTDL